MHVPPIHVFSRDLGFIEGPVRCADEGVALVSISHGCVYVIGRTGAIEKQHSTGGGPNGLAMTPRGLFVAQNGGIFGGSGPAPAGIQCIEGDEVRYLTTDSCVAPNDLCFGPDGLLYVSDPQTARALNEPVEGTVLVCDPATGHVDIAIQKRHFPNGVGFDTTGRYFYLAQTYPRIIERFSWTGGRLESDGVFCHLSKGRPDGLAVDTQGNVWICTPGTGGIEVFSAQGAPLTRFELGAGSMTTNCCFGGPENKDLFVTAGGTGEVLRLATESTGLPLFPFRKPTDSSYEV